MKFGKTIRIHLADGTPTGIRHAEVGNWTGQAIVCPRGRLFELRDWDECQRQGVYLLHGADPEAEQPMVYFGEAENVFDRLKTHIKDPNKEFFDRVVIVTSKDENLTKAHVKYLESRMVEIAQAVDRVRVANSNTPPRPALPRSDRDVLEEFLDQTKLLLGSLGFVALEPLLAPQQASSEPVATSLATTELHFRVRDVSAQAMLGDNGFVVKKGSQAVAEPKSSDKQHAKKKRQQLLRDGDVVREGDLLVFKRDVRFDSPSAAACMISGTSRNGPDGWKSAEGKTLKELELQQWGPEVV